MGLAFTTDDMDCESVDQVLFWKFAVSVKTPTGRKKFEKALKVAKF